MLTRSNLGQSADVCDTSDPCRAGMMSHPPIPISELAEHIELLKANDNLRLSQEYEVRNNLLFHINKSLAFYLFRDVKRVKTLLHKANLI